MSSKQHLLLFSLIAVISTSKPADLHGADPMQAKAAIEPIDRIRLSGLQGIIKVKKIQEDLNITPIQWNAIHLAIEEYDTKRTEDERDNVDNRNVDLAERFNKSWATISKRLDDFDKSVLDQLTEVQKHRLRQVSLQVGGPEVFLDRVVIRDLELTADQEDEIDRKTPHEKYFFSDLEKGTAYRDRIVTDLLKILTIDQKARWKQMIGKPLPTVVLMQATYNYINPTPEKVRPPQPRAIPIPIPVIPPK